MQLCWLLSDFAVPDSHSGWNTNSAPHLLGNSLIVSLPNSLPLVRLPLFFINVPSQIQSHDPIFVCQSDVSANHVCRVSTLATRLCEIAQCNFPLLRDWRAACSRGRMCYREGSNGRCVESRICPRRGDGRPCPTSLEGTTSRQITTARAPECPPPRV